MSSSLFLARYFRRRLLPGANISFVSLLEKPGTISWSLLLSDKGIVGQFLEFAANRLFGGVDGAVAFVDHSVEELGDLLFEGILFCRGKGEVLDFVGDGCDDKVAPFVDGEDAIADIIGGAVVPADGFGLIGKGMDFIAAQ